MEDFSITNISEYGSYNDSYDFNHDVFGNHQRLLYIVCVFTWIIFTIGLPLTVGAICGLCSLVRKDHVAPIYVINLLISDLIQFCCMIAEVTPSEYLRTNVHLTLIHIYSLMPSVGFMVCIALERYLVIAWPLWYRFKRNIKTSVVVCVVVWALPLVIYVIGFVYYYFTETIQFPLMFFGVFLLLPLPLFIFFLAGTLKALSASISVPSDEKRRIVGVLVLVLLIYTLLFMPTIVTSLQEKFQQDFTFLCVSVIFYKLSPLADLILYIFMRKGIIDKLLASVCCCRMDSNDTSTSSV